MKENFLNQNLAPVKKRSSFVKESKITVEEAIIKFGKERVCILQEEDTKLSLEELMKKYELSRSTAWRMLGRGYSIRGFHDKECIPDQEWCDKNYKRIEEAAKKSYLAIRSTKSLDLPGPKSSKAIFHGDSPEDLIQNAILEIIMKSGTKSFLQSKTETGVSARDNNSFLFVVARNHISELIENRLNKDDVHLRNRIFEGEFEEE